MGDAALKNKKGRRAEDSGGPEKANGELPMGHNYIPVNPECQVPVPLLLCVGGGLDKCAACGGQLGPGWARGIGLGRIEMAEDLSPHRELLSLYCARCYREIFCMTQISGDVPVPWP